MDTRRRRLAAALSITCLGQSSLAGAQTLDNLKAQLREIKETNLRLTERLAEINSRLRKLEHVWIGYGAFDRGEAFDRGQLAQSWFRCSSENVTFKTVRPGVFRFEFKNHLPQRPVVIGTISNRWGDLKVEASSLSVMNVDQSGFTVETFQGSEPTNVAFEFLILRAAPVPRANLAVRSQECSG